MSSKYTIEEYLTIDWAGGGCFSQDGKNVAFLSNRTGTSQIYTTSIESGTTQQLTDFEDRVESLMCSPVKDELVFGKSHGGDEKTQLYIYDLKTDEVRGITNDPDSKYAFGTFSHEGVYISYSTNKRNKKDFDIIIRNQTTGELETVTEMGGWLSAGNFSPKGTFRSFIRSNSNDDADLYLYSLDTKEILHMTPHEGKAVYGSPRWLPDESGFFVSTNFNKDQSSLYFYDMAKKEFALVMGDEWGVTSTGISRDGKYLSVVKNIEGYAEFSLYLVENMKKVALKELPEERRITGGAFFVGDSNIMLITASSYRHTTDLWLYTVDTGESKQLTVSKQGVAPNDLIEPQLIRYASFDGLEIPAFVFYPTSLREGEKVPVVVYIHGGPEAQYRPTLSPFHQYLVSNGYAVIAPNVRGSYGYGKKYMALDDVEKRMDSVQDLIGLHTYISQDPGLDEKKVVLMGGSYGGFMTLAGLAFYPQYWAGGVNIVGIFNFITFLKNTASYRRHVREAEYGSLIKDEDFLKSISPISKVENITAPLMVIHGTNDPRVPLNEAEQLVNTLTDLQRTVELLVYEDEGHGLAKRKNILDAYPKIVSFLDRICK